MLSSLLESGERDRLWCDHRSLIFIRNLCVVVAVSSENKRDPRDPGPWTLNLEARGLKRKNLKESSTSSVRACECKNKKQMVIISRERGGIERKQLSDEINILGNEVSEVRGVSSEWVRFPSIIGTEDIRQTIVGIRMSKHGQVQHWLLVKFAY